MTKVKSITDIAALYESVRAPKTQEAQVVEEKAAKFPKGTFPQSTKEVKATTAFEESGPNKALNLKKKKKAKKAVRKPGKVVEDSINSFMKSEFDKLFENVIGDEPSFEVEPSMGPEGIEADEAGAPETDEASNDVTITLSKDLAQQLHDVLMGVLEGEEEGGEAGEEDQELEDLGIELGEEEGEGESEEEKLNDATEMTELKDTAGHALTSKNNKVAGVASKVSSGKADASVTDEVSSKTQGHPLDSESPLTKPGHQKVATSKTSKPGANFFN